MAKRITPTDSGHQIPANHDSVERLPAIEEEVLQAIRELKFGAVEVVVHQGRVTEIRQTRRRRLAESEAA